MESFRHTKNNELFNSSARFAQISKLRSALALPEIDTGIYADHSEQFIDSPTIGIEIEMTWAQAFPTLAEQWKGLKFQDSPLDRTLPENQEFDKLDQELQSKLTEVKKVIPRVGIDGYWEFSFHPSKHIGVTIAEAQTLYDASILHEGLNYATQMTIAGINNDRDAFAFLCALELSGGSSPERIESAATSLKGTWARKGKGGLLKRRPEELMGMDTEAYELRTLITTSSDQLTSLLLTAHQLAVMHQQDPDAWKEFRTHIESRVKAHGLNLTIWGHPRQNQGVWSKYGQLLSK